LSIPVSFTTRTSRSVTGPSAAPNADVSGCASIGAPEAVPKGAPLADARSSGGHGERVVLAGPVLQLGETYLDAVRAAVTARAMPRGRESCEIVVSDLDDPALLGAAALVLFPSM
jgi:hypothetical protein